jgi:cytochrome b561
MVRQRFSLALIALHWLIVIGAIVKSGVQPT